MRYAGMLAALAVFGWAQPAAQKPEDRGWTVLEAALKAAGGRDKLAAVRDLSFELRSQAISPQGKFDIESKSLFVLPDTVRQESKMPFGQMVMAVDRLGGWRTGPQGTQPIPTAEVQRIQADLARANVLFRPPANRAAVRWVAAETVEDRACDVIEIANVSGSPLRLSVDRETGDVLKRSYRAEAPGGGAANVEEILSDYRQVGGLRQSFHLRVMRNGKLARESVTRDLKVNTGLKVDDLLRQP